MEDLKLYACCFFGHRKIDATEELESNLFRVIENLITKENITTFLFGDRSEFDSLCLKVVTRLKKKHPYIKRVYVRAAYANIGDSYKSYLLQSYEETYYPESIKGAGRASYVERNQEMINRSNFCIVYYDENYLPPKRKNSRRDLRDYQPKSGTAVAYDYAIKKKKKVINLFIPVCS